MDIKENVYNCISKVFNVPVENLNHDLTSNDISEWDSLKQLMLIQELEMLFNIKLNTDDILSIVDIKSIVTVITKRHKS